MSTIKLLVFDDNLQFRAPLEQHIKTVPAIELLGVETDVSKVLQQTGGKTPDLVLYASSLIKSGGTEPLHALRDKWPEALYYRLTVFDDTRLDEYDFVKGFDGSVSRSQIEAHLKAIVETFKCNSD